MIILIIYYLKDGDINLTNIFFENTQNIEDEDNTLGELIPIHPSILHNSKLKGELFACSALESLLKRNVLKGYRGNELKNPLTNKNLEIDCYDPISKIGVEYNGKQHYEYPNSFHKSELEFYEQLRRDRTKEQLCKDNGIYLIRIPFTIDTKHQTINGLKNKKFTHQERYQRQYDFLHHILDAKNKNIQPSRHYTTDFISGLNI